MIPTIYTIECSDEARFGLHPLEFDPGDFLKILQLHSTERKVRSLQRYLRGYVEEWIASGVRKNGSEVPEKRSFSWIMNQPRAGGTQQSNWEYEALADCYRLFCEENSLITHYPRGAKLPEVRVLPRNYGVPQEARRMIVAFLSTEWRYLIARCRNPRCNHPYFYLKPGKMKKTYANGLFCSTNCNKALTARKLTKRNRQVAELKLLEWASSAYAGAAATGLTDLNALKKRVESIVNQRISSSTEESKRKLGKTPGSSGKYVTLAWVTRHWNQILDLAKGGSSAKA